MKKIFSKIMMPFRLASRFIKGDWWSPTHDIRSKTWGISHLWKWHPWSYGMTMEQALEHCRKLNHGLIAEPSPFGKAGDPTGEEE